MVYSMIKEFNLIWGDSPISNLQGRVLFGGNIDIGSPGFSDTHYEDMLKKLFSNQIFFNGKGSQFRDIVQVQFVHNVGAVTLHGFGTDT